MWLRSARTPRRAGVPISIRRSIGQLDQHSLPHAPTDDHAQVKEYLARKKSIILPSASSSSTATTCRWSTDALIATHLARLAGTRSGGPRGAHDVPVLLGWGARGDDQHLTRRHVAVISDTLVSLASQGFRNFYLLLWPRRGARTRGP